MAKNALGKTKSVTVEFEGSDLGDGRLGPRLTDIVARIAEAPGESFPKLFADPSELEAFYRFTKNDRVAWWEICRPHQVATAARCAAYSVVRIAHDTTDFIFSGEREGLGPVMRNAKGFFLHLALAVAGDDTREALGVIGMTPYVRNRTRGNKTKNAWKLEARARPRHEKESARWENLAIQGNAQLPPNVRAIHVMDQEADDFALLSALIEAGLNFVVRGSSQRKVYGGPLQEQLDNLPGHAFREVQIQRRTAQQSRGKQLKMHPVRDERLARLEIRWGELLLPKPQHSQASLSELKFAVVQVFEPHPPEGEAPICWTLFTSEQVLSVEDALAVADHYKARWVIEEYFKALKTGCAIQERQLTTLAGLVRTLAIFAPIAWHLLAVRTMGRRSNPPPATTLFTPLQLFVLAALYEDRVHRPFPAQPTVREAMLAIAKLGGHIPVNGNPGWITLGRGMETFLEAQRLYALFQPERCDRS